MSCVVPEGTRRFPRRPPATCRQWSLREPYGSSACAARHRAASGRRRNPGIPSVTAGDMTPNVMYRHSRMPISVPQDAHIGTAGCRYEHPAVPIIPVFVQVKGMRGLRVLYTSEGTRQGHCPYGRPCGPRASAPVLGVPLRDVCCCTAIWVPAVAGNRRGRCEGWAPLPGPCGPGSSGASACRHAPAPYQGCCSAVEATTGAAERQGGRLWHRAVREYSSNGGSAADAMPCRRPGVQRPVRVAGHAGWLRSPWPCAPFVRVFAAVA